MDVTYYEVLEVNESASPVDIKKSHRRLSKKYHPDKLSEDDRESWIGEEARARFAEVTEAYTVLSDPAKRAIYDEELSRLNSRTVGNSTTSGPSPRTRSKSASSSGAGAQKKHTSSRGAGQPRGHRKRHSSGATSKKSAPPSPGPPSNTSSSRPSQTWGRKLRKRAAVVATIAVTWFMVWFSINQGPKPLGVGGFRVHPDPDAEFGFTSAWELLRNGEVVSPPLGSVPINSWDPKPWNPERAEIQLASPSGRYVDLRLCGMHWCDIEIILDLKTGEIIQDVIGTDKEGHQYLLLGGKTGGTQWLEWSPDERFLVGVTGGYADVPFGLQAIDLRNGSGTVLGDLSPPFAALETPILDIKSTDWVDKLTLEVTVILGVGREEDRYRQLISPRRERIRVHLPGLDVQRVSRHEQAQKTRLILSWGSIRWGACPFECCTYREWQATRTVPLYRQPDGREVAHKVTQGDWVNALNGFVQTVRSGKAWINGFETSVASYEGEGSWAMNKISGVPFSDFLYEVDDFSTTGRFSSPHVTWQGQRVRIDSYAGKGLWRAEGENGLIEKVALPTLEKEPATKWWVYVKAGEVEGWTDEAKSFTNKDTCG